MWVKRPIKLATNRVFALELQPGNIWSLNEKSRRFAFIKRIAENALVQQIAPNNKPGEEMVIDLPLGVEIVLWPSDKQPENMSAKEFCLFDRVCSCDNTIQGTVIDINRSRFPNIDLSVLWDIPVRGDVIGELHPHEVCYAGQRALNEQYELAKEARQFLVNIREQQHDSLNEEIKTDIVSASAIEQQFKDKLKVQMSDRDQVQIAEITKLVIDANAKDLKMIMDQGTIMITAGTYNYEIDAIVDLTQNYTDYIYGKVDKIATIEEHKIPIVNQIIKHLASTILDSYFLIRQAYVRKNKGKWGVFSKAGKLLGTHDSKKQAIAQLRAIEAEKHRR